MKTDTLKRVARMPMVGRSLEVRHARRGFGIAMRRGLHGAKNWVFELDEDGLPRSAAMKALRIFVVLLPVWLVVSAATGGPERGGQEVSLPKTVLIAVLATVAELGWFSARERRLGREEPWTDLPDLNSESDESGGETKVDPSPEAPTEVLENVQVEEVEQGEDAEFHGDDGGENEQNAQIPSIVVPEATGSEMPTLVIPAQEGTSDPVQEDAEQATSEGVPVVSVPRVRNAPLDPPAEAPAVTLDKATRDASFPQVAWVEEGDGQGVPQAISEESETATTESERNDLPDTPTVPFRPTSRTLFRETEEPQVEATFEPVRETVQGVLQVQFAQAGPYLASAAPVHEGWWIVAPDVELAEDSAEEPVSAAQEELYDPWADQDAPDSAEARTEPVSGSQRYPEEVQRYFASRISVDVDDAEKEAARDAVIAWALKEVEEGRKSQSEVARLLGVGKATVSRWVNTEAGDVAE